MRERPGRLRLPEEPLGELALLDVVLGRDADGLQRDETPDHGVAAEVDDPHRSLAQLAHDLVAAEALRKVRGGRPGLGGQTTSSGRRVRIPSRFLRKF